MTSETHDDTHTAPREVPCQPPPLPPGLQQRLAGHAWTRNLVGEAGASVYRVHRAGSPSLYLKHGSNAAATAVVDEMARLVWLAERLPVPAVEYFQSADDQAWLLTRAVPGRTAYEWLVGAPDRGHEIVAALARVLSRWHGLPPAQCPFNAGHTLRLEQARQRLEEGSIDASDFDEAREGWTPQELWQAMMDLLPLTPDPVVTHGDYSLDNVLLDERGQVTGVIDVGRAGVADRYQDLAILWNCLGEFGPGLQATMVSSYGLPELDAEKLRFHLCLDECF